MLHNIGTDLKKLNWQLSVEELTTVYLLAGNISNKKIELTIVSWRIDNCLFIGRQHIQQTGEAISV